MISKPHTSLLTSLKIRIILSIFVIVPLISVGITGCGSGAGGGFNVIDQIVDSITHWAKSFGGGGSESANSVQQTNDGGFVIAGETSTNAFSAGGSDFWLIRLDLNGDIVWEKAYGGTGNEVAYSVRQTSDGGFVVAGSTTSFGAVETDFWILKVDSGGVAGWQKTYGGSESETAYSIQQTNDGGYVVAGSTSSFGAGNSDFWVIKLDVNGNIVWQKTYGGTQDDIAYSVRQTSGGEYIVAGSTKSHGAGAGNYADCWVIKLNNDGTVEWHYTYGGTGFSNDIAYSVQQTSDGRYIVAGTTNSFSQRYDFLLLKLYSDGDIQWNRVSSMISPTSDEIAWSVQQTADSGYIVAGTTTASSASVGPDMWVLKLDGNGNIGSGLTETWSKSYGGLRSDAAYAVRQTVDGGYIIAGDTGSYGAGMKDAWVLKVRSDGIISSSAPVNIGTDTDRLHATQFVDSSSFNAAVNNSSAIIKITNISGVDTNATVETQASDE